jgi:hypothetical protein
MSKDQKMREVILEFSKSGLSRKVFCEQRGINLHTFVYWLGKIKQDNLFSGFIAVEPLAKKTALDIELEYPNGVKLRIAVAENLQTIHQLIALY